MPLPVQLPAKGYTSGGAGSPLHLLWDNQGHRRLQIFLRDEESGPEGCFRATAGGANKRVTEPLDVPAHKLEADGTWTFPDFTRGSQAASGKWNWEWDFNGALQHRTEDVSNLGMLYALTGDEKYAAFARQILLALADAYGFGKGSAVPDPNGYDHFAAYGFDGGDDATFLAKACHGYDLIYKFALALCRGSRAH